MTSILKNIRDECVSLSTVDPVLAKRFYKVSRGGYAEKEAFLGITVPCLRKIVKKYGDIELNVVEGLLRSQYNEERLLALLILVKQFQKETAIVREKIFHFYCQNMDRVNNWNLVDSSAHYIVGQYLIDKDRVLLEKLAASSSVWERRIAIVATWYFIRHDDVSSTFSIAKLLLDDTHDLIHKAVGWMLREAGKKDQPRLIHFLLEHGSVMPKTMLRYSMEKFSTEQKMALLTGSCRRTHIRR